MSNAVTLWEYIGGAIALAGQRGTCSVLGQVALDGPGTFPRKVIQGAHFCYWPFSSGNRVDEKGELSARRAHYPRDKKRSQLKTGAGKYCLRGRGYRQTLQGP